MVFNCITFFSFADNGEMSESFPYRAKAMFAFEEIGGVDVCFFGMHVQEYGSDCQLPNTRYITVIIISEYLTDMPPGTDCPYPIRILAFFEMIRPYHLVIRI